MTAAATSGTMKAPPTTATSDCLWGGNGSNHKMAREQQCRHQIKWKWNEDGTTGEEGETMRRRQGKQKRHHLMSLGLLVRFSSPSILFFVTNKLFKLLTRTADHADDDSTMKPTQCSPHTAASPCSRGGSRVLDNNDNNDNNNIHVQNLPCPHHRCRFGRGYWTLTHTCTRMHPWRQPAWVYKPVTFHRPRWCQLRRLGLRL